MYCISSASERKYEIACTSWSSCLKTLWAGVKHWRTALHRFYVYRKPIDHLHDLAIWKWLKNMYISFDLKCICVWCLDNWSRICQVSLLTHLHGKVKLIAISSDPNSPFHCHVCIFCRRIFFLLVTLDLCLLLIHRDLWKSQKWQILISNLQSLS